MQGADDAERWEQSPLAEGERAIAKVADWGPAEDWSDWSHAEMAPVGMRPDAEHGA